ncbi:MAG: helix-turn-helix domain-containing protein [Ktedonobacterales bacterium]
MLAVSPPLTEAAEPQVTLAIHMRAVESAIHVMHTHLREPLTLGDLASAAYLSPAHFNRIFRRQIGIPPVEYLSGLRLQTARRLLLSTSLSVTDICFEVGYTSPGSFTTRFTQLAGLSPRLVRQHAHRAALPLIEHAAQLSTTLDHIDHIDRIDHIHNTTHAAHTLQGRISAPPAFQGVIYVGLFTRPIPQGSPIRCAKLYAPGPFRLTGVPDGIYYLLAAAFPVTASLQSYLLPGEKILHAKSASPLIMRNGHLFGDPNLILRPPVLTDPPLVMALPLL